MIINKYQIFLERINKSLKKIRNLNKNNRMPKESNLKKVIKKIKLKQIQKIIKLCKKMRKLTPKYQLMREWSNKMLIFSSVRIRHNFAKRVVHEPEYCTPFHSYFSDFHNVHGLFSELSQAPILSFREQSFVNFFFG